jgi:hypothetical protein
MITIPTAPEPGFDRTSSSAASLDQIHLGVVSQEHDVV